MERLLQNRLDKHGFNQFHSTTWHRQRDQPISQSDVRSVDWVSSSIAHDLNTKMKLTETEYIPLWLMMTC